MKRSCLISNTIRGTLIISEKVYKKSKVSTDDKKGDNHGYFFYRKAIEIL
jgi:hypothetical protein